MKNLPVDLSGYKLMVSEAPTLKMRTDKKTGEEVVSTVYGTDIPQYVVNLFAKPKEPGPTGRRAKGEEIKVTFTTEPSDGIDEGMFIQLIAPTVSHFEIEEDGVIKMSGLSYAASALSPVGG